MKLLVLGPAVFLGRQIVNGALAASSWMRGELLLAQDFAPCTGQQRCPHRDPTEQGPQTGETGGHDGQLLCAWWGAA